MEFEIAPELAHLFADATAAFIRSRADFYEPASITDAWNEVWLTFRDAETGSVKLSIEAGRIMWQVWGRPEMWRDRATRDQVTARLRPQWKAQMRARLGTPVTVLHWTEG